MNLAGVYSKLCRSGDVSTHESCISRFECRLLDARVERIHFCNYVLSEMSYYLTCAREWDIFIGFLYDDVDIVDYRFRRISAAMTDVPAAQALRSPESLLQLIPE